VPAAAFGVCLVFSLNAFAQGSWLTDSFSGSPPAAEEVSVPPPPPPPPPEDAVLETASEKPAVAAEDTAVSESSESAGIVSSEPSEPAESAAAESSESSESTESAAAEISEEQAEEAEDEDNYAPSFTIPVQTIAPEPVVETVEVVEEPTEPVVVETPIVANVPAKTKKCEFAEKSGCTIKFRIGFHGAVGVSAFQGHKAVYTESFGSHAIQLGVLASVSTGLVFSAPVTESFRIAWGLQYSVYTAHGEFTLKTKDADFGKLNQAGVELHAFEMPVLANLNIGERYYMEIGPQFGANLYAKIYANEELKKPYLNLFAVGPAIGFGVKLNSAAAVGVRGYFNVLEYAENSKGRPWTVQAGVTSFCK